MSNQKIQPKQGQARDGETAFQEGGTASNDNAPSKPAPQQWLSGLSWAWIILSGAATCAWLAGAGWMAVKLFRWLVD